MSADEQKSNPEAQGLIALRAWRKQLGVSDTTVWRWSKRGWIHPINIAGKPYLTRADIAEFQSKAQKGEFSKVSPLAKCT